MTGALDRIPGPIRRVVAFTLVGALVYGILLVVGALLLPIPTGPGTGYSISATVAAGIAALYLVYLGGFARFLGLLR